MNAGAFRHFVTKRATMPNQEPRRTRTRSIIRIRRENSLEISIVIRRPLQRVVLALPRVVLAKSSPDIGQALDSVARFVCTWCCFELAHDFIHVLEFSERGPIAISGLPARARSSPHRE